MSKLITGKNINWKEISKNPILSSLKSIQQPSQWHGEGTVWNHTMNVVVNMLDILELNNSEVINVDNDIVDNPKWIEVLLYAALYHDVGKKEAYSQDDEGNIHFPNHASLGVNIFKDLYSEYEYKTYVLLLIGMHMDIMKKTPKQLLEIFEGMPIELPFLLRECDLLGSIYDLELQSQQIEELRLKYLECKYYIPNKERVELEFVGTYTKSGFEKSNKILGEGCMEQPLSVGHPCILDSGLQTEPVTKIINETTFRVGKQLYKINSLC